MYNNSSGIFPTLVFLFVVFLVGGIILSQFVVTIGDLNTLRDEKEKTDQQLQQSSTSLDQAQQELEKLRPELAAEQHARQALEQTLQMCTGQLNAVATDRDGFAQQLAATTGQRDDLVQKLTRMTAERDGWINLATGQNVQIEDLRGQVNSLASDRDVQIKLANHWMDEAAVLRVQVENPDVIPVTGQGCSPNQEKTIAWPMSSAGAWWLLTIPVIIAYISGYEVYRIWDRILLTLGRKPRNGKIQVQMAREELDAYLRWRRYKPAQDR